MDVILAAHGDGLLASDLRCGNEKTKHSGAVIVSPVGWLGCFLCFIREIAYLAAVIILTQNPGLRWGVFHRELHVT